MLNKQQLTLWNQLYDSLSAEQRIWFAGYVQGTMKGGSVSAAQGSSAKGKILIYFATETGNTKSVAQQLAKQAKQVGWNAQAAPLKRLKIADLKESQGPMIFVAATHGEGDPPEPVIGWFEEVQKIQDTIEGGFSYAVLGLGDSSYPEFCKFARDLDAVFQRLGGEAFHDYKELDVDFASHTKDWIDSIVKALPGDQDGISELTVSDGAFDEPTLLTGKGYSRLEPVVGMVSEIINLNDQGSRKQTFHIEIDYEDTLQYAPGDAIGIIMPGDEEITPRLYSIASAPSVHGRSIHLTVALAWHLNEDGSKGYGLCSHYLSELKAGDEVKFYVQQNQLFKLPEEDRDIIMVGPGTGIAPFRSFVWERMERGASGRNWLFFGDQHAHCDFLYQAEWIEHVESEALHRIDLAFSRDQSEKVYVHHRMREQSELLMEWLDGGAAFYVCGSKDPMSVDVERVLLEIIAEHKGGKEAAESYLEQLQDEDRYIKDVY